MAFTEKPPILTGDNTRDIARLRDFLFRWAGNLDKESNGAQTTSIAARPNTAQAVTPTGGNVKDEIDRIRKNAQELKALIIKTAKDAAAGDQALYGVVEESIGALSREMSYTYLARPEFGTYTETVTTQIRETAKSIVESYNYTELIEAANRAAANAGEALDQYMTSINGEIRRGFLTEPGTGDTIFGIAISSQLSFTGVTRTVEGETYYELTSGQTLGLYTSTGWQFWAGGVRIGWFSSLDGMLHVPKAVIEDTLQLSSDWRITSTGGFGLRYIGE